MPTIFCLGLFSLVATRALFLTYYPEEFVGTVPTISEVISAPPGSSLFVTLVFLITPSIVVAWSLAWLMYRRRLEGVTGGAARGIGFWSSAAFSLGLVAALALLLLALYPLHAGAMSHFLHLQFSKLFYTAQVCACLCEIVAASRLRKLQPAHHDRREALFLRLRIAITATNVGGALLFLYLYVDREALGDRLLGQQIFVTTEYFLCALCFAYPACGFHETRRHFAERAEIIAAPLFGAQGAVERPGSAP
jgi:hypothetical protein